MPPKRHKTPSRPKPKPDWTWTKDLSSPTEITSSHIERSIGLSSSFNCHNKLLPIQVDLDSEEDRSDSDPQAEIRAVGQKYPSKAGGKKGKKKIKLINNKTTVCTVASCRTNLCCLNHLGGKKWLDPDTKQSFFRTNNLPSDPWESSKDPSLPVGLRNLGATCYANAFLQVWYRIIPFRSAVYSCANDASLSRSSPCYQLAMTFAGLQKSWKSYWDPSGLVEALKLGKGEQQDASEFSKLFMQLLQREFNLHQDPKVKAVISNQFEGKLKYKTECLNCNYVSERPENYLELEISMEGNECSLTNQLQTSLSPEKLMGDNQYFCSRCDSLQDAQRSISLETIPPTLHFSLLRFVFDPKTFDRKKSKATIKFPPRIDMGRYVDDGQRGEIWYELKGVVEHRGTSAHHGHFVAKVYDDELKQWILCDDETTSKIRPMTNIPGQDERSSETTPVPVVDDDMDDVLLMKSSKSTEDVDKVPTKKTAAAGRRDVDSEKEKRPRSKTAESSAQLHKSQHAYMLVYELANEAAVREIARVEPVGKVAHDVDECNKVWEDECQIYDVEKKELSEEFEAMRQKKLEVMKVWNVDPDEDGIFVTMQNLEEWVIHGLSKVVINKPRLRNSHQRVISPTVEAPGDEPMGGVDSSTELVTEQSRVGVPNGTTGDIEMNGIQASDSLASPTLDHPGDDTESESDHCKKLKTVLALPDPFKFRFSNKEIRCQHDALDPRKGPEAKYIAKEAWSRIIELGGTYDKVFSKSDICSACVEAEYQYLTAGERHARSVQELRPLLKSKPSGPLDGYLISTSWLRNYMQTDWPELKEDRRVERAKESREAITCEHGNARIIDHRGRDCRVITDSAHALLITDEPDLLALPVSEACSICAAEEGKLLTSRSHEVDRAALEAVELKFLKNKSLSHRVVLMDDEDNFIIPNSFVLDWEQFLDNPVYQNPPNLMNEEFFCPHDKLNIDFNYNPDLSRSFIKSLRSHQWEKLRQRYPIEDRRVITVIPLSASKFGTPPSVNQDFCKPCWQERCTANSELITLRLILMSTDDEDAIVQEKDEERPELEIIDTTKNDLSDFGTKVTRRSSRLSVQTGKTKRMDISVRRDISVADLKRLIEKKWDVPSYYQKLTCDEIKLNDRKMTLIEAGIVHDDTIYIRDCSADEDSIDRDDVPGPSSKARRAAGGFHNTLLHGLPAEEASESEEALEEEEISVTVSKPPVSRTACSACTFMNTPTAVFCAICDTAL